MKVLLVVFLAMAASLALVQATDDEKFETQELEDELHKFEEPEATKSKRVEDIPGLSEDMLIDTIDDAKKEIHEEEERTPRSQQDRDQSLQKMHYKRGFVPELEPVRINAMIKERTIKKLAQKLGMTPNDAASALEGLENPSFQSICKPIPPESANNKVPRGYRTVDGIRNNRKNPNYGRVFTPLTRLLPPDYADGISTPRKATDGNDLPNARNVSAVLFTDEDHPSKELSHMVMIYGQFINHDTALGAQPNIDCTNKCGLNGECFGISIPNEDSAFRDRNITCMFVKRDVPFCGSKSSREQLNTRTPFLDASAVYSELPDKFVSLRDPFDKALLIEMKNPTKGKKNLLSKEKPGGFCRSPNQVNEPCFIAGDVRVNENPGLTSMHTMWNREHNRIARRLKRINRHWCADKVFFETRKILGAMMQHITYKEYLPLILNVRTRRKFKLILKRRGYFYGYNKCTNPSIINEFISAAFRFGHSQIQNLLGRFGKNYHRIHPSVQVKDFFNPSPIYQSSKGGLDSVVRGLVQDSAQTSDRFFAKAITENLRRGPTDISDLAAINLQRAREHGIAGYNAYREHRLVGLDKAKDFDDLKKGGLMDNAQINKLKSVYNHVNDIDLFVGGLFEKTVKDGVLGPTFNAIVAEQFHRIRVGDSFWYENRGQFTYSQLKEIRKISLARIICDNTDGVSKIRRLVMDKNQKGMVPCWRVKGINLNKWRQRQFRYGYQHRYRH